jgi:UDP-N-acetylmuramoyl-L-alanyl-D-glutamate--2,6-diaminopimelate ligase
VSADASPISVPSHPVHVSPLRLSEIASVLGVTGLDQSAGERLVTGLTLSSTSVSPGHVYAALPGSRTHGARFAADAARGGAVAILTDAAGAELLSRASAEVALPVLVVPQPRQTLGSLAALVYGAPASTMTTIGVTGTHGKTTVTALMEAGLTSAGKIAARVGTNGTFIAGHPTESKLTTPEAPALHALFAVMRDHGVEVCAMEVSSHALVQGRVDGVIFDLAVFTNLGRDHLDFHSSMENYFEAKAGLFTPARARSALLNIDDEYGRRLRDEIQIPVHTYSPSGADADWRAVDVRLHHTGADFTLVTPDGATRQAQVRVPGAFNVGNALAALAGLVECRLDLDAVVAGIAQQPGVEGRMERIPTDGSVSVVVDYAHKPDAVHGALQAMRPMTSDRLIVVLGAGGDRDRGKRQLMGAVSARLADLLVITDDNPRWEDPSAIRADIRAGADTVAAADRATVCDIGDRREAIAYAISVAASGDSILVAGKGHEQGQEIAGTVHPFDDREVVRAALADAGKGPRR